MCIRDRDGAADGRWRTPVPAPPHLARFLHKGGIPRGFDTRNKPPPLVRVSRHPSRTRSQLADIPLKFVLLSEARRSRTQSKDLVPADKTTNSSRSFHHT